MKHVEPNNEEMRYRKITLADGRYMIFYTFGETGDEFAEKPAHGEAGFDSKTGSEKNDV